MIRIVIFFVLILALGYGFAWVADRPGDVTLEWQGNQYQTSLMVVLAAITAVVATIMIIWSVIRAILDSPRLMRRFFRNRRRDRGYEALSQGLIAAGAGDATIARRHAKESEKLLGSAPLVELLDAQTALLEGKREEARKRFESMLQDDKTRLIALRGLYLEAEKQGAQEAARHYAEEAHKEAPTLGWAGNANLRYRALDGDWEGALKALEANRTAGLIDKDAAKRQRAVLLTAQAYAEEPADPVRAARLAREAHKLDPMLVPAAMIGAKALSRNNDIGRAAGIIETAWKKEPHPELAEAYVGLRMGDSATDRLKRARKLAAMRANHPEGNIAIAEAAIEANEWEAAREAMKPVLTSRPTERACLIMADIEEGQYGDKGRMRDWLSRAVRAPRDAAWTANGVVSDHWLPVSPVTGEIDAFEWKVPVEELEGPATRVLDADDLSALAEAQKKQPAQGASPAGNPSGRLLGAGAAAGVAEAAIDDIDVVDDGDDTLEIIEGETGEDNAGSEPASEATPAKSGEAAGKDGSTEKTRKGDQAAAEKDESDSKSADIGKSAADASDAGPDADDTIDETDDIEDATILDHRPDDPGVDHSAPADEPARKRFGLF